MDEAIQFLEAMGLSCRHVSTPDSTLLVVYAGQLQDPEAFVDAPAFTMFITFQMNSNWSAVNGNRDGQLSKLAGTILVPKAFIPSWGLAVLRGGTTRIGCQVPCVSGSVFYAWRCL